MRKCVNRWWLMIAGNDETRALVPEQVLGDRASEVLVLNASAFTRVYPELIGQTTGEAFNLQSLHRHSVIRLHSRRTRRALDHIQPVHVRVGIAPRREIARVARRAGESRVKEIGIERNYDVGFR